jgi:hypothetical protein
MGCNRICNGGPSNVAQGEYDHRGFPGLGRAARGTSTLPAQTIEPDPAYVDPTGPKVVLKTEEPQEVLIEVEGYWKETGGRAGQPVTAVITHRPAGGVPKPFTIYWGDSSAPYTSSSLAPGVYEVQHVYSTAGNYNARVEN